MTSQEAMDAAKNMRQIHYDGMVFRRIVQFGLEFNENGEARYFVQLLGQNGNSVVLAPLHLCEVKWS